MHFFALSAYVFIQKYEFFSEVHENPSIVIQIQLLYIIQKIIWKVTISRTANSLFALKRCDFNHFCVCVENVFSITDSFLCYEVNMISSAWE